MDLDSRESFVFGKLVWKKLGGGIQIQARRLFMLKLLLVVLLGALIYSNTLRVPFVLDDRVYITNDPALPDFRAIVDADFAEQLIRLRQLNENFRTRIVTFSTFAVNYQLHGYSLAGYHLANLLIHLVNALLVCRLVTLTMRTRFAWSGERAGKDNPAGIAAISAALLFVSHPVQTQAVTYISQRFTSLATLFYLLAMTAYISWRLADEPIPKAGKYLPLKGGGKRTTLYALALVATVLAMLSKEISFTLPLMLTMYEFFFFSGNRWRRWLALLPFLMTMLIIPMTILRENAHYHDIINLSRALNGQGHVQPLYYLYTQFIVVVDYLGLLVLPINQSLDHFYSLRTDFFQLRVVLSASFLASLIAIGVYLFLRSAREKGRTGFWLRLIAFGIFWFFLALSVESTLLPLEDLMFEHRLYLPSVGFFLVLVATIEILRDRMGKLGVMVLPVAVASLVLVWSGATYARNEVWRDRLALWEDAARKSPEKFRPHYVLGRFYQDQGRDVDAFRELEAAVRIDPFSMDGFCALAALHLKQGNNALARIMLDNAAGGKQLDKNMLCTLGDLYLETNRLAEAEQVLRRALEQNADNALMTLGKLYLRQKRFTEAVSVVSKALELNPEDEAISYDLGLIRVEMGDHAGAVKDFQRALAIDPEDEMARQQLEQSLAMVNR